MSLLLSFVHPGKVNLAIHVNMYKLQLTIKTVISNPGFTFKL